MKLIWPCRQTTFIVHAHMCISYNPKHFCVNFHDTTNCLPFICRNMIQTITTPIAASSRRMDAPAAPPITTVMLLWAEHKSTQYVKYSNVVLLIINAGYIHESLPTNRNGCIALLDRIHAARKFPIYYMKFGSLGVTSEHAADVMQESKCMILHLTSQARLYTCKK